LIGWDLEAGPRETAERVIEAVYIASAETGITTWADFQRAMEAEGIVENSTAWRNIEGTYNSSIEFPTWELLQDELERVGVTNTTVQEIQGQYATDSDFSWSDLEDLLDETADPEALIREIRGLLLELLRLIFQSGSK